MSTEDLTGIGELQALLGEGASFEGKLVFEGRVRIDGRFEGEITSDAVLIVGPAGDVNAKIAVGTLIVRGGTVRGEVRAQRLVEIYAPARVEADIESPQLFLDKGAAFDGKCTMPEKTAAEAEERTPEPDAG